MSIRKDLTSVVIYAMHADAFLVSTLVLPTQLAVRRHVVEVDSQPRHPSHH